MEAIEEFLHGLEEDGKLYAHFFTHPAHRGYYGVWVRERTPQYVSFWLPHSPLAGYHLAFSIEMPDTSFTDYLAEIYRDQVEVDFLGRLYKIDDVSHPQQWIDYFNVWKQEKIRLNRVKWLEQYPWLVTNEKSL